MAQWVKGSGVAMSYDISRRHGSDLALLWLWRRPVATTLIQSLAWEFPYATGAVLKRQKKKKKKKKKKEREREMVSWKFKKKIISFGRKEQIRFQFHLQSQPISPEIDMHKWWLGQCPSPSRSSPLRKTDGKFLIRIQVQMHGAETQNCNELRFLS